MDFQSTLRSTYGRNLGVTCRVRSFVSTKGAELTDEELVTVLTECEGMFNNRPLTYISSDHPKDLEPLTLAQFITTMCTNFLSENNIDTKHTHLKKMVLLPEGSKSNMAKTAKRILTTLTTKIQIERTKKKHPRK